MHYSAAQSVIIMLNGILVGCIIFLIIITCAGYLDKYFDPDDDDL